MQGKTHAVRIETEQQMIELGERLAQHAKRGMVVALAGPLGVGKTTLARGVLRGLGWTDEVRSPTFNLIHEYATEPPVCHADLYRIRNPQELADLGLDDYLESHLCLIEWPEVAGELLPSDAVAISLEFIDGARDVRIEGLSL